MEPGIYAFLPFCWITKKPPQGPWTSADIRFNSTTCLQECTKHETNEFSLTWDDSVPKNPSVKVIGYATVVNLARQAPWHRCWCHSRPCHRVARSRFHCCSCGYPLHLGTLTDLSHIAPVAISPTAGQSRPLSFVSSMLLARPSPVCYVCCLPLIELACPSPMFVMSIVFP